MSAVSRAQEILLFWFGPRPYPAAQIRTHSRLWFGDDAAPELLPQADELIRERFGSLIEEAARGGLADWESSPRRRLALILVLDQFSRHVFRHTARAFAQDPRALSLAVGGLQIGADAALDPIERNFFYMPLMHAESLTVQEESVAAFRRLATEAPAELRKHFEASLRYATLHRDIIARFGRFPYRNRVLGRDSSAAEAAWLESEGEDFGQ